MEKALRSGKNVICNSSTDLPLKLGTGNRFYIVENEQLTPDYLWAFMDEHHEPVRKSQTLIVIEECQLIFSEPLDVKSWQDFFSQHRALGCDILLVTSNVRNIVRDIRKLVEQEVSHWNGRLFKFRKRVQWYPGIPIRT